MSIIPYNNFTVRDLSNVLQPYVNSCTEFGYFSGGNLGTIPTNKWYSLPAVLNTNNGIATRDASGLILNPGIYSINLSLFPTITQDGSCNISFNFGTTYLSNISTTSLAGAFGGVCPTGMFTYDPFYNPYSPGIITWVADGYSSANSTFNNFIKNSTTNELSYNYYNAGYLNGPLYSGICTTEIKFILDSSATIYFNVSTNSNTGITMGNSCFTLELISTNPIPAKTVIWRQQTLPTGQMIYGTSSSSGQYLAAVVYNGSISTSSNYGGSWTTRIGGSWHFIASSSSGQYLAASFNGAGKIYISSDYGVTWTTTNDSPSTAAWNSIAFSSTGQYLAAVTNGNGIWRSTNYGANWGQLTNGLPAAVGTTWRGVASSSDGSRLAAVVNNSGSIYTSSDSGGSWSNTNNAGSRTWYAIASSSTGQYLAACARGATGGIWTSSDYGVVWTQRTSLLPSGSLPTNISWFSMTSSSTGQYLSIVNSNNGYIYTSSDYGVNWTAQISPGARNWNCVAYSSNGSRLLAVGNGTGSWMGVLS
jgi:hypothetical protein